METKVSEKRILGVGKNLYLICWSKCANFGYILMRGNSEKEVYQNQFFSVDNEVNFIITKIDENNLPVIFKGGQNKMNKENLERIKEINVEIEEKGVELVSKEERKDCLENGDNEEEYDDFLDECYPDVKIGNISFCASRVLKELDEVAYNCGLDDYNEEELSELEDEIEELNDDIAELENELNELNEVG